MRLKGFFLVISVVAATAALWPAAGSAGNFKGIVVAKQRGALLVASPAGLVRAVTGRASIGSRIVLSRGHAMVVGRAGNAHIRGIVVRRIGTTLFLSSNRHLLAIHNRVGQRLADTTPASTTTTPTTTAPGAVVVTDVAIANGRLEEEDEDVVGQINANTISVQATVKAVAAGSVTLDVQGQTLSVPLPAGLTLPASLVGQTVTISLSLANDHNANDDDDDDDGDHHGGDDHGGGHHGGDGGGDD